MARLTQKQETFCLKYFELGNAAEAARLAKYSPKTADAIGRENLQKPTIQARIDELRGKLEDAAVMDKLEILKTHTEIARGRIGHLLDEGQRIKQGADLTNASIQELETSDIKIGKGENARMAVVSKIKLHDPVRSMQEIARLRGFYPKDGDGGYQDNRVINFIVQGGETLIEGIAKRLKGD